MDNRTFFINIKKLIKNGQEFEYGKK